MTAPLASLAIQEFERRKASVDQAVARHAWSRADGEAMLANWAAIAMACGAAPREVSAIHEAWQEDMGLTDVYARMILLEEGPSHATYTAELARARAAAGEKARANPTNTQLQARHLGLDCLAIYLGLPAEERPAPSEDRELEAA